MKRMTKEEQKNLKKHVKIGALPGPPVAKVAKTLKSLKDKYDDLQGQIRGGQDEAKSLQRAQAARLRQEAARRQLEDGPL